MLSDFGGGGVFLARLSWIFSLIEPMPFAMAPTIAAIMQYVINFCQIELCGSGVLIGGTYGV